MKQTDASEKHIYQADMGESAGWNSPEIPEYKGIKSCDQITWVDDNARNTFNKPAFGYGKGPFEVLKIRQDGPNRALFEIKTAREKIALISSLYFKKVES